jgi:hypothetical protein
VKLCEVVIVIVWMFCEMGHFELEGLAMVLFQ